MKKETPLNEDAPTNAVGGGIIAAIGVGDQGEPPMGKTKNKYKKKNEQDTKVMKRKITSFKTFAKESLNEEKTPLNFAKNTESKFGVKGKEGKFSNASLRNTTYTYDNKKPAFGDVADHILDHGFKKSTHTYTGFKHPEKDNVFHYRKEHAHSNHDVTVHTDSDNHVTKIHHRIGTARD
jgi:hypothetical protein